MGSNRLLHLRRTDLSNGHSSAPNGRPASGQGVVHVGVSDADTQTNRGTFVVGEEVGDFSVFGGVLRSHVVTVPHGQAAVDTGSR